MKYDKTDPHIHVMQLHEDVRLFDQDSAHSNTSFRDFGPEPDASLVDWMSSADPNL